MRRAFVVAPRRAFVVAPRRACAPRRAFAAALAGVLVGACQGSEQAGPDPCGELDCGLPDLDIAAEVHPAADSGLAACEFPPGSFEATDSGLRVRVVEAVDVEFRAFDEGTETGITASLVVSRPSLIPGMPPVSMSADTDTDGRAVLSLLPVDPAVATYDVRASPTGTNKQIYPPAIFRGLEVADASPQPLPFPSMQDLVVIGVHVEYGATPYRPLRVHGVLADGTRTSMGIVAEESREFDIRALPFAGAYQIVLEPGEGEVGPTFVYDAERVTDGPVTDAVELALPPLPLLQDFCLTVRGADAAGAPIVAAGAEIVFQTDLADEIAMLADGPGPNPDAAAYRASAVAGTDGAARVTLLPLAGANRLYDVAVRPPADSPLATRVIPGFPVPPPSGAACPALTSEEFVALDLRATVSGNVRGMLADGSRAPVEGATVEAVPVPGAAGAGDEGAADLLSPPSSNPQAPTGPDGGFLLWADPGTYDLAAQNPPESGFPNWWSDGAVVDDPIMRDIALPPPVTAGVDVMSEGGESVATALVRIFVLVSPEAVPRLAGEGTTDGAGRALVVLPDPPPE